MKRKKSKKVVMSRTQILRRAGWTLAVVLDLLGAPDRRKPRHGDRPDILLYEIARVLDAEKSSTFKKIRRATAYRRRAGQKAVGTKLERVVAEVKTWTVEVERWSLEKIYDAVGRDDCVALPDPDASFQRDDITDLHAADFVLWNLTNIDTLKMKLNGRVGRVFAEYALSDMALPAAEARYPELLSAFRDPRRGMLWLPSELHRCGRTS